MFLEVFFRFLIDFSDNFVKNRKKFWSCLGEITRKIKNLLRKILGEIVRYLGIILEKR